MNRYPTFDQYQAVLQHPAQCFELYDLKRAAVETDLWGLPRVRSGGFALIYKLSLPQRALAVRCFHRHVQDRAIRYAAICTYLTHNPSEFFVPVRFVSRGIQVGGNWYPITFMQWVEGDTLEAYLMRHLNSTAEIAHLSLEFQKLVADLERLSVAHGDLSHRNILVRDHRLMLVDYDGMYVPALQGRRSCELGNIHFQPPARGDTLFGPRLDRFSALVIFLALEALVRQPDLWQRFDTGGEGLLFSPADFRDPFRSALLREIEALPGMAPLVGRFRKVCIADPDQAPSLVEFIGSAPLELPRYEKPVQDHSESQVFSANDRDGLLAHLGEIVTVVGEIDEIFKGTALNGSTHYFLNCGDWRKKCFTVVYWSDALQLYESLGRSPLEFGGKWVRVTGLLTAYQDRLQIAPSAPTELFILPAAEAQALLAHPASPGSVSPLSTADDPAAARAASPAPARRMPAPAPQPPVQSQNSKQPIPVRPPAPQPNPPGSRPVQPGIQTGKTGPLPALPAARPGQTGPLPAQPAPPTGKTGPLPAQPGQQTGKTGPLPALPAARPGQTGPLPALPSTRPSQAGSFAGQPVQPGSRPAQSNQPAASQSPTPAPPPPARVPVQPRPAPPPIVTAPPLTSQPLPTGSLDQTPDVLARLERLFSQLKDKPD